jgi:uncharacterized circularly permuted ATP-grasp superfamily protein
LNNLIKDYKQYPETWDEMFDKSGKLRDVYSHFEDFFDKIEHESLNRMKELSSQFFRNQGITFTVYSDSQGIEKIFPFDVIPRIIQFKEWKKIEKGIKQRIKALNLFLKDVYNEKFILKDGLIPPDLLLNNRYYIREMISLTVPKDVFTHISGVDLIRDQNGEFFVLEDNLRTPSGVSYMLENREITKRLYPNMMPQHKVLPVDNYPQLLYNQLKTLVDKSDPEIVLLTPGLYNSAYYEHTTLARLMGVELVEGNDLILKNHEVFMKTASGLKKIDIIYRRIDDDFLDPLVFNSNSVLGLAGIMESYRQGKVCIVNAPGVGIADDKAVYSYVPDIIKYYLNEKPILKNIQTYRLSDKEQKKYVIDNIQKMVVKKTDGSGGYGMLMGHIASNDEIEKYTKKIRKNPENYIAQPILNLSTAPCIIEDKLAPRCVDLRPFALCGANKIIVCPGGLSRVAMKEKSLVVNSSQGGGSKDTWIINK